MEDQGELDHDDEDKYYSLKRQGEKEILVRMKRGVYGYFLIEIFFPFDF